MIELHITTDYAVEGTGSTIFSEYDPETKKITIVDPQDIIGKVYHYARVREYNYTPRQPEKTNNT